MKTTHLPKEKIKRTWHLVDAKDQILGRLASPIASLLIGKHKPNRSFHHDHGDYVVVINADKIRVTGRKLKEKIYYRHSGWAGNLKELSLKQIMAKDPRKVISHAVSGMLPKNKQRKDRLKRLKVFVGDQHRYQDKFNKKNG
jgi:large subunit ribosomal protein L13